LWWMIQGIWALFSLLFIFLYNRKQWLDNFMFIIHLNCSKLWIWMGKYFRDILLIRISRGANTCPMWILEKPRYSPHFKFVLFNERLDFNKTSKGLTMQINFHSLLWSDLPRVITHLRKFILMELILLPCD